MLKALFRNNIAALLTRLYSRIDVVLDRHASVFVDSYYYFFVFRLFYY